MVLILSLDKDIFVSCCTHITKIWSWCIFKTHWWQILIQSRVFECHRYLDPNTCFNTNAKLSWKHCFFQKTIWGVKHILQKFPLVLWEKKKTSFKEVAVSLPQIGPIMQLLARENSAISKKLHDIYIKYWWLFWTCWFWHRFFIWMSWKHELFTMCRFM